MSKIKTTLTVDMRNRGQVAKRANQLIARVESLAFGITERHTASSALTDLMEEALEGGKRAFTPELVQRHYRGLKGLHDQNPANAYNDDQMDRLVRAVLKLGLGSSLPDGAPRSEQELQARIDGRKVTVATWLSGDLLRPHNWGTRQGPVTQ